MYANNPRDHQGLDRSDASPDNHPTWTHLESLERDLLIAVACLTHTQSQPTAHELNRALEPWHPNLTHGNLYGALEELTTATFLEATPTTDSDYHLTTDGHTLLETYTSHLTQILTPQTVTISFERPITPGDAERAYCELLGKTQEARR